METKNKFAGILKHRTWKNEPWRLVAAFKEVAENGDERVSFGSEKRGLMDEKEFNDPRSISGFCGGASADELSCALKAIEQAERNIEHGTTTIDAIPEWGDIDGSDQLKKLYLPKIS